MTDPENESEIELPSFRPAPGTASVKLSDVSEELGLDLPIVKAEDLAESQEEFVIQSAKPWKGKKGGVVYFCHCAYPTTGEAFATNLGGQAVVEKLQAYFVAGPKAPIQAHLVKNAGGRFEGYYTLE